MHTASRAGESADAFDDAACVQEGAFPVRAAVADGATESVYAGTWAELLAQHLVDGAADSSAGFAEGVEAGRAAWWETVEEASTDQPWYVTAKVEEGAFATALGLSVHEDGQWRAVAVGDCCLFHLRDGTLRQAWPIDDPEGFGHRPTLVSSLSGHDVPTPRTREGTWAANDVFLLATDAVAAWLLRTDPDAAASWDEEAFREHVRAARADGALRNDDATLLVLEITG